MDSYDQEPEVELLNAKMGMSEWCHLFNGPGFIWEGLPKHEKEEATRQGVRFSSKPSGVGVLQWLNKGYIYHCFQRWIKKAAVNLNVQITCNANVFKLIMQIRNPK